MTFTELEYVLMLTAVVLMCRIGVLNRRIDFLVRQSDRYAEFLMSIGRGEGRVVLNQEDETYEYKPNGVK